MITFKNPGLIDIDAAMLLGVNAKEKDDSIGFFGTGLKFAIATLLRTGHEVTIYRGLEHYGFYTVPMETRGKVFQSVVMNDRPLGFTTALGRNWQVWQAFRELYSNALDENGEVSDKPLAPSPNTTTIGVEGYEITQAWGNRFKYFMESSSLAETTNVSVHPGKGIYCRKILVQDCNTTFAYNFKDKVPLTEERMLAEEYASRYRIISEILTLPKIFKWLLEKEQAPEHMWPWPSAPYIHPEAAEALRQQNYDTLPNSLKPIFSAATLPVDTAKWRPLLPSQKAAVDEAKKLLSALDITVEAPILLLWPPKPNLFGMAMEGQIGLAERIFAESSHRIASTLLEEHLHVSMGLRDNTRHMQDVLLELAIKGAAIAAEAKDS